MSDVVVSPKTLRLRAVVPRPADIVVDASRLSVVRSNFDLPTEVIAESLTINITFLEPTEDGGWVADVGAFGQVGRFDVGEPDDILIEQVLWIRELVDRWSNKLKGQ